MRNVEVIPLDLASPGSIDRFAGEFLTTNRALDMLIHNAGLSGPPLTRDDRGYEIRFATNHLGDFQLTARLWSAVKRAAGARVVAYSSIGHNVAGMDFDDPNFNQDPTTSGWLTGSRKPRHRCLRLRLIKGP